MATGGGIKSERDVDAPHRSENIRQDAAAARKAGHVVEQHRLVADAALVDVDDAADLLLVLGALDVLQLAGGAQLRDPGAQILPVFAAFVTGFLAVRDLTAVSMPETPRGAAPASQPVQPHVFSQKITRPPTEAASKHRCSEEGLTGRRPGPQRSGTWRTCRRSSARPCSRRRSARLHLVHAVPNLNGDALRRRSFHRRHVQAGGKKLASRLLDARLRQRRIFFDVRVGIRHVDFGHQIDLLGLGMKALDGCGANSDARNHCQRHGVSCFHGSLPLGEDFHQLVHTRRRLASAIKRGQTRFFKGARVAVRSRSPDGAKRNPGAH